MKRFGFVLLLVAVVAMLGGTALAQDTDSYFVTYYSGNQPNAPDATLRIINDGYTGANIYANIFVFDDSEELTECCSCAITPDGLLSESVKLNLTANPLTGGTPNSRGVIKVLAGTNAFLPVKQLPPPPHIITTPGLHGWMTHIQGTKVTLSAGAMVIPAVTGPFFVTEAALADASLSPGAPGLEQLALEFLCYFDTQLSGKPCTCQPEDFDY